MDPNAALNNLRLHIEQLKKLIDSDESPENEDLECLANDVVDNFEGLDNWLSNGGFLPKSWKRDDKTKHRGNSVQS